MPLQVLGCMPKPGANDLEHSRLVVDCGKGAVTLEDSSGRSRRRVPWRAPRLLAPLALIATGSPTGSTLRREGQARTVFTVGISGSVQHVIGIRGAGLIAAVNTDEDAPIFSQADLGVVADLREFRPALLKRIQERDVQPVWNTDARAPASPSGATLGKEV